MLLRFILYILSSHTRIALAEHKLIVGFGSKRLAFDNNHQNILAMLSAIQDLPTCEDANKLAKEHSVSKEDLERLIRANILTKHNTLDDRYSRHRQFYRLKGYNPGFVQEKIGETHITLIGCGGIGNIVSTFLVTSGIGYLHLIDPDLIEESNLTRQWAFTEDDIGAKKVNKLREFLVKRNSSPQITVSDANCYAENIDQILPAQTDLVILSADSPGIHKYVNEYYVGEKIPLLNVGYVNDIPTWGPFYIPGEMGCINCLPLSSLTDCNAELVQMASKINSKYQSPSHASTNLQAASLAGEDIIKFLCEDNANIRSKGRRVGYYSNSGTFSYIEIDKSVKCICR